MFFCKNCGTKIENDNAKFCPNCGQNFAKKDDNVQEQPQKAVKSETAEQLKTIYADDDSSPTQPKTSNNKSDKGLLISLIVLAFITIGAVGALIYLYKTGRLVKLKEKIYTVLHVKKSESENNKKKKSTSEKASKTKKNASKTSKTAKSAKTAEPRASAYQPKRNAPATYVYQNNSHPYYNNQASAESSFKYSLSSSRAYLTGVSPLSNSNIGNAPAVIISDVIVGNATVNPGGRIVLHSKFYADTPPNISSQSVKLTYKVYGNGITAYNNSYINVNKPGIYLIDLPVNIPSNMPAGAYTYTLTVASPATIEQSAAAYIKVR